MKILICDDSILMRTMIKRALKDLPEVEFIEATNGFQGVELYKIRQPDAVTMDITMNAKNGIVTASEILACDPKARIVMVTALGMDSQMTECEKIGVKAFVTKPFDPVKLLDVMRKTLTLENAS